MFAQNDGKIRKPIAGAQAQEAHKFNEDVYKATSNILRGLNKGISYGDGTNTSENQNLDGWHSGVVLTPGVAGTLFVINHGLGRVPIGFHVIYQDKGASYWAANVFTTTTISLACTMASVNIRVFIF